MFVRRFAAVASFVAIAVVACGTGSGSTGDVTPLVSCVRTVPGLEVVSEETVGLNGADNDGRAPLEFLLVRVDPVLGTADAGVAAVTTCLGEQAAWTVAPVDCVECWWTDRATTSTASFRVGPYSRFADMASILEGRSRSRFREAAAEVADPLIVVSIDPEGNS